MNYEEFKEKVKQEFLNFLPEKYQHLKLDIRPMVKVNVVKDGLTFLDTSRESWASPTIYVEDMYKVFRESENYQKVLEDVAIMVADLLNNPPLESNKIDLRNVKENIVFQLINTEQNKEMLNNIPHREFHDLSIVYRWVVERDEVGMKSAMIMNSLMQKLGLNEEQIFNLALENTKRLLPPTVRSMNDIMKETYLQKGMPEELSEIMSPHVGTGEMIWVISNNTKINGACSILYDDVLQDVATKLNSDLYILPSSIHETITVPVNMREPDTLAQWVNEINMNTVDLDERLSNQVYHYDKKQHKLTMATNTPMKRLDGFVAEPQILHGSGDRVR